MATINDLIEDWIQIRSTLQRQLKLLQSGELRRGDAVSDSKTEATVARIKGWIDDLNGLLKEYARADRP